MKCPSCSTDLIYEEQNKILKCNLCGTSISYDNKKNSEVTPKKFIEFEISLDDAKEKVKEYFSNAAFEYKDYAMDNLEPIYIPYFMYDCVCESEYVFQTLGKNKRKYLEDRTSITPEISAIFKTTVKFIDKFYIGENEATLSVDDLYRFKELVRLFFHSDTVDAQLLAATEIHQMFGLNFEINTIKANEFSI